MNNLRFSKLSVGFQKNSRFYNTPSIFLQVHGCNLKCFEDKTDTTTYCKFIDEKENTIPISEAKKFINAHKNIKHIVICGGEPLLYKTELEKFLNDIWRNDMVITIHTNGTLPMLNPLSHKYRIELYIVNLCEKRLDCELVKYGNNLRNICLYSKDYLLHFNFEPKEIVKKSNEIVEEICKTDEEFLVNFFNNHPVKNHVVFIPKFKKYEEQIRKICIKTGTKFSMK